MSLEILRFGLSRHHGGARLLEGARQFAALLGEAIGLRVSLSVAYDYDHLLKNMKAEQVDLAWMPPLVAGRAMAEGASLAAVAERSGAVSYRSALLVREGDRRRVVKDLKGARAAWVDPSSAGGYLFPRLELAAAGLDLSRDLAGEEFFGSSVLAAGAVVEGKADLCACYCSEAAAKDPKQASADVARLLGSEGHKLRVVGFTRSIPPDGMVIARGVGGEDRARIRDALIGLHRTKEGVTALESLLQAGRLAPAGDEVTRLVLALRDVGGAGRG